MASGRETLYNIITILMIALTAFATVTLGGLALLLPPQTPTAAAEPTLFIPPSATPTLRGPTQEPTPRASATPTLTPTMTFTPTATTTVTITPTLDATQLTATEAARQTAEFTPTATPIPPEYVVQGSIVDYDENPQGNGGCAVSVIAGEVVDDDGEGVAGLEMRLEGEDIDRSETTGDDPQYGDGGWEFVLSDGPRDEVVFLQLFDDEGDPLSVQIAIELINECDANRALVIFIPAEG